MKCDEAEIHRIMQDVLVYEIGAPVLDADIYGGKIVQKFFNIRRQLMQADGVNGGHANGAGNDVLELLQAAVQ